MAIFSRRVIQEIINQNAHFLTKEQIQEFVNRLNSPTESSLPIEWEVVILNVLHKIGQVRYEQSFGGPKNPDIFFISDDNPTISFIADIATVSDKGYEQDNPVRPFIDEAIRILRKNNIKLGGFHYEIGSTKKKRGVKLKIPPKSQFSTFFSSPEFKNFVSAIKNNPTSPQRLNFISEQTEVRFYYDPQGKYVSGSHASYNTAHSLKDNPIYNALKSKAQQLKQSGYSGVSGIFLCDGGCGILSSVLRDYQSYSLNAVINEFFREYSSVYFVLVFTVKEISYSLFNIKQKRFIEAKLFSNPVFEMPQTFLGIFNKCVEYMPNPIDIPLNAKHKESKSYKELSHSLYGGSMISEKTIKISSRGLLELLSGKIEQNKFLQNHCFIPTSERPDNYNPFDLKLNEGRLITNIRLEKSNDEDDDWIVFEFGEPDPAISSFVIPKKK